MYCLCSSRLVWTRIHTKLCNPYTIRHALSKTFGAMDKDASYIFSGGTLTPWLKERAIERPTATLLHQRDQRLRLVNRHKEPQSRSQVDQFSLTIHGLGNYHLIYDLVTSVPSPLPTKREDAVANVCWKNRIKVWESTGAQTIGSQEQLEQANGAMSFTYKVARWQKWCKKALRQEHSTYKTHRKQIRIHHRSSNYWNLCFVPLPSATRQDEGLG